MPINPQILARQTETAAQKVSDLYDKYKTSK